MFRYRYVYFFTGYKISGLRLISKTNALYNKPRRRYVSRLLFIENSEIIGSLSRVVFCLYTRKDFEMSNYFFNAASDKSMISNRFFLDLVDIFLSRSRCSKFNRMHSQSQNLNCNNKS